jgi:hypothetical protein
MAVPDPVKVRPDFVVRMIAINAGNNCCRDPLPFTGKFVLYHALNQPSDDRVAKAVLSTE